MRAIITFHSIDDSGSVLSYPPRNFARFVEALVTAGIPILDLNRLLSSETCRGVALTFDDGMQTVLTDALPVLRDFDVPAHLFLATGAVDGDNRWPGQPSAAPTFDMLDWDQIEKLHRAGIRIEAHTANHPDLRLADDARVAAECDECDEVINSRIGRRPRYFAYPYGSNDQRLRALLRTRYRASVTTEMRVLRTKEDMAALPRIDSYYLKPPWVFKDLEALSSRAYLGARGIIRRLRGML